MNHKHICEDDKHENIWETEDEWCFEGNNTVSVAKSVLEP